MTLKKWIRQRWQITKYYWQWLWMSRADRARARAMKKLMSNLLGNAPMDQIMAGESCSWNMTPGQKKGVGKGIQEYVKAVTGEEVKIAMSTQSSKQEGPVV